MIAAQSNTLSALRISFSIPANLENFFLCERGNILK